MTKVRFIRKMLAALLICLTVVALFAGCGRAESEAESGAGSVTAAQIIDSVFGSENAAQMDARLLLGDESFDENCQRLYGAAADSLTQGGIIYDSSGATANEVSVIAGSADCEQLLRDRIQTRINDFEGYQPGELDKIQSAEVFSCGELWVLVISDNAAEIKESILAI